jgi:hypothetical protein
MQQDSQATKNNQTRLLPYLIIATPALEELTIRILTHGKGIRT